MKSGITIAESLTSLIEQTKSEALRQVLIGVMKDIENGQSLSKAMEKHPRVFDKLFSSLISVGEESGTLQENLVFLADQLTKEYELRKKVQGAMLYPVLIFIATASMSIFISLFILPKLTDFFASFSMTLPLSTRILLGFAHIMKLYGTWIIGGLLGAVFLALFLLRIKFFKRLADIATLRIPLFGELIAYGQLSRFSRNLGTLLKSGVPLAVALDTAGSTLDHSLFYEAVVIAQEKAKTGIQLATALQLKRYKLYKALFPSLVIKMIAVGEKTGKLDETLLYLSEFYDQEIDNFSKNIMTIIEPVMLLGIGVIVGFVAIAIIGPIYQLTGSIQR